MRIDVKECARLLLEQDDILILTHAHPDGDTLGCGFALCRALLQKGKFAYVKNEADIPPKYNYLFDDIVPIKFTPRYVVAVDVATEGLLGAIQGKYHIDLCIDHHGTNTDYADRLLLDDGAAAASEIIYKVIREMGVPLDKGMANCLYTGISTDTGCFRYASATAESYRIAADLIEAGADNGRINRVMFETKTKTYARLERLALESMRFYLDERVAIITVTQEMYHLTGSNEQETEGLAPLTRQIEGVEVGITIREKPDGTCKASLRTFESVNAAEIAVPDQREIYRRLDALQTRMVQSEQKRVKALREQFEKTSRSRALQDPMAFIDDKRMLLDYTQKNLAALAQHQMAQRTQQFTALAAKLDALSPLKVLGRGYAVARNEQGQILRAAQEAAAGEKIEVLLGQGSLNCTVNACNMGGNDDGKNV
jgi:phosphoesterase RecJ-like protein